MQRERAFLDWPLLVGLCAVTLDLMIAVPTVPPPAPAVVEVTSPAPVVPVRDTTEERQLHEELSRALAIAFDADSAPIDAFEAMRRARTLDVALGTGMDESLTHYMRWLAPRAARAYAELGDVEGAQLARHTAEMVGAP